MNHDVSGSLPGHDAGGMLPLAGTTVLDFSQFLAGPSCALRLADMGARVIKIERPAGGDAGRGLFLADVGFDEDSALFHTINRNKQSYTADLKDPADAEAVRALLAQADVMIHNFRPGIMDRLGFGWEAVSALNPRLIYAGVNGYGADGPWRDRPGQDLLVQSLSGMAWLSGDAGQAPVPAGLSIVDMMAGAQLCQGVLALLVRRGVTGRGGRVDVSLLEAAIDLQFEHLSVHLNRNDPMPRRSAVANGNVYLSAPYGIYATADGYLALAMAPVDRLGDLLGLGALGQFPASSWFDRRDEIKALIRDHLPSQTTAQWLAVLEPAGIWAAPVLDWPALQAQPAFGALGMTQRIAAPDGSTMITTRCPIRIDGQMLTSPRAGPRLGADRAAIDGELAA
ncbi:CaiB/BaiF CoA transferase family protein [Novosphingobium rosa]|uniref:CaiB/BaiF CoA transferase family protein n=1 Tax=Novosphingobium rosa TaxID=76978 RepID=UPI001FE124B1|nr:CaiB/BaiF CoA-transferase family protein [Novosphingobium rosa]